MKQVLLSTILASIALIGFVFVPTPSLALDADIDRQNQALSGEDGANFTITDDPRIIVARIFRSVFALLGTLFFVYTVWGGYQVLISRGKEDEVSAGRKTIATATIGILVMLMAYGITSLVLNSLLSATQEDQDGFRVYREGEVRFHDPLAPPPDPAFQF